MNVRNFSIGISIILLGAVAFAGGLLKRTEARRYCSLPGYEYRSQVPQRPVSQVSSTFIPLSYVDEGTPVRVKVFQMDRSHLNNDHCQLSLIALTITETGNWKLNFIARQDPRLVSAVDRPMFERFNRNLFCISVRGEGGAPIRDPVAQATLGKAQLFQLDPQPIVLEKGQVRELNFSSSSDDVRKYFDLIDRIEVSLIYQ